MICRCRNCGSRYDEFKSRADFKGYCTAGCLHEMGKSKGYKKPSKSNAWRKTETEYSVLHRLDLIGNLVFDCLRRPQPHQGCNCTACLDAEIKNAEHESARG